MEKELKSVLIMDDDEFIRDMYTTALTSAGISVLTAKNGQEGVQLALKHRPSVILLDIEMPIMDGLATAKKIREDSWGKTAHIIFLTNHSDPKNVVTAVAQKPEDYIIKANTSVREVVNLVRIAMHT